MSKSLIYSVYSSFFRDQWVRKFLDMGCHRPKKRRFLLPTSHTSPTDKNVIFIWLNHVKSHSSWHDIK